MIVGITGHRNLGGWIYPNPVYNYVYVELEKTIKILNPSKAITGMALGTDQVFAVICIRLGIPLIAAIPFEGQENKWPDKAQKQYQKLLNKCEFVHVVCDGEYANWKMQERNEWIVNNVDHMIVVYNQHSLGGTYNCFNYIQKVNKEYTLINPETHNFDFSNIIK